MDAVNFQTYGLQKLGFRVGRGGTHSRRTMMFTDLSTLLEYVDDPDSSKEEYHSAVVEENCLGKRPSANRKMTFDYLVELYSLDLNCLLFRALRFFWDRDQMGRPLLALLCAYARDAILRPSAQFILSLSENDILSKADFESYVDSLEPGRYSENTLQSIVRNLSSSWTQSGHLCGRSTKIRSKAIASPGSTSLALLLGYLTGLRGAALFKSEFAQLLDCGEDQLMVLAEEASRSGWIVVNRIGSIVEVLFPRLITEQELEWLSEQA